MAIKRYSCTKDTTITNAFKENMLDRGEESNMGASDIAEVFSIFGQATSSSIEKSRVLFQFDVDSIIADREATSIPTSGSVNFYMRVFNAPHAQTLPRQFTLQVLPVSSSWTEGIGLDMETYSDEGQASWLSSSLNISWTSEGGDYLGSPQFEQFFDEGTEDLEIDITNLVESWIDETTENKGVLVKLSGSQEDGSEERSYYTKRFFARGTEFFFKKPVLEARWQSSKSDDRGDFYFSSSLASEEDNTNKLYLYNYVRGIGLKDIPGMTGSIYVDLYDENMEWLSASFTGSWESIGIYVVDVALEPTTSSIVYDVWGDGNGIEFYTGSFVPKTLTPSNHFGPEQHFTKIINLKNRYSTEETNAMFRLFIRDKNWQPTLYTVSNATQESQIAREACYRVFRVVDNYEVIAYDSAYTKLSYDANGNYFTFDISLLEPGYMYAFQFRYNDVEQPEIFNFKVEE